MRGGLFSERGIREAVWTITALAALAEIAAGRCYPARWFVLALLRNAERIVWRIVIARTGWDPAEIACAFGMADDLAGSGSDPADTMALAWRLRALAALLDTLLPPGWVDGGRTARPVATQRRLASQRALSLSASAGSGACRPAPDTS